MSRRYEPVENVLGVEIDVRAGQIVAVRKQRTPKGTRRLLDETFARLSFQELPFRVQKAASRFCRRECLRILPHSHAPQLLDREALHSLSVNARAPHAHNMRRILFRGTISHRKRIGPRPAGPAKLTRHLATCAASGNLVVRDGRVKRNSGATAKKIGDTIGFSRSLPLSRKL
jgi:hypothetical protein